jgi:glycosyltransferase involved in cell wall biosynthesis
MLSRIKSRWRSFANTIVAYVRWAVAEAKAHLGSHRLGHGSERRLLLLAWYFPPDGGGGVFGPFSLANYAATHGWEVSVLAREVALASPAGRSLYKTLHPSIEVCRVAPDVLQPSSQVFPSVGDGFPGVQQGFLTALKGFAAARTAWDVAPSVVVASGPPFHWFVAGYFIARYFSCPLVLSYRDEWTQFPFDFVTSSRADWWWEQRCQRFADAVTFTTRSQLDHQIRTFPTLAPDKCHVVPNGWEPSDYPDWSEIPKVRSDQIVLSFVGNLGQWTLPGSFLGTLGEAIAQRSDLKTKLRVRFVGQKHPEALRQLEAFPHPEVLILEPEVSKKDAIRVMRESSLLLLVNEPDLARYRPGKLYDYLAVGRPILVFGEGGEVADLVRELRAGCIVPWGDAHALEQALLGCNGTLDDRSSRRAWLLDHTRESTAAKMIKVLDAAQDAYRRR